MRVLLALALLVPAAALAGCADCTPTEVPAVVTLTRTAEEVRTLPILASGATSIGPVKVPDSHGRLELRVDVTHNLSLIRIEDLALAVKVGSQSVPVRILDIDGGRAFHSEDGTTWEGSASSGGKLTLWWAVDRNQVASASALLLGEGAAYEATVSFAWDHRSCLYTAQGSVEQAFSDFVQASVNARTFQLSGTPQVETTVTGAGFRANFTVRSGLEATLTEAAAKALVIGTGATGGLALHTFPTVGWTVDGAEGNLVKPGQTLRVHSAATALARGAYAASGTTAGTVPQGGLVLFLVDLVYTPKDPTPGTPRDEFAHGRVR